MPIVEPTDVWPKAKNFVNITKNKRDKAMVTT